MKFLTFLLLFFSLMVNSLFAQDQQGKEFAEKNRKLWLSYMDKVARPVIYDLANDQLKEKMPVVLSDVIDNKTHRAKVAYLEAFGRTFAGIAPWLNVEGGSKDEIALRNQYREWTLKAVANAVNPEAKNYLQWTGGQPLVDASYVALAMIRCPWIWEHLDKKVQNQLVDAIKLSRSTVPVYTNWILFSGMVEAFFCKYGLDYDAVRIEYGVREFTQHWYTGDGMFSDGMQFHLDFYNSHVIQPYLNTIVEVVDQKSNRYKKVEPMLDKISKRYAEIQERQINTDGTYAPIGRSIVYRGGSFQHLADMALRKQLPESLKPAQVREALAAVFQKTLDKPSFTKDGWLQIGLYGNQPKLADFYINTGSLYMASLIFLPLGLPDTDEFWTSAPLPWTAVKIWTGQDVPADHALDFLYVD
jgi:hypothetical protein